MTAFPQIRLSKSAILGFGALAAMVSVPAARAQTVFDAQVPFSFSSPTLDESARDRGRYRRHGLHCRPSEGW